ncbi:ATP-binding protein [Streptomyces lycii]|uniref:ATP-binding protein n=1 Tax=Streptomyces lycii TaxID=2654337 RepID=A0ABQ7FE49_9ACTN|nr:ATP-binding protein [Streptomyces lycii]
MESALDQLGHEGELVSDAVLAVSELVANAVEHATGPYEIRLRRTGTELVCEVEDHDPLIPELPLFTVAAPFTPNEATRGGGLEALGATLAERGRGLHIVHYLSKGGWGFRRSSGVTKVAWLRLPVASDDRCQRR